MKDQWLWTSNSLQVCVHEEHEFNVDTKNLETEITIFGDGRWYRLEWRSKGGERVEKTDSGE